MRKLISAFLIPGVLNAAAFPQQVEVTGVSQDAANLKVTVNYTLADDAIVTVKVHTNGVRIAAKDLPFFVGDVSKPVVRGTRSFTWLPQTGFEGLQITDAVRFELTAWPTNCPPDYLVVDLRNGEPRYYPTESDLPAGGIGDDVYRKELMVFRHIHAAGRSFLMGSGTNEYGRVNNVGNNCNEDRHEVRFTHDFWCGVFEVTQYQYWRCSDNAWRGSALSNETCWATRPVQNLAYSAVRGTSWPTSGFDGVGGILKKLRSVTGLRLDLLTEAQWEFACRAETTTGYNNGIDLSVGSTDADSAMTVDPALSELGRYGGNGGRNEDGASPTSRTLLPDDSLGTARVGSYKPNAWGLYDMHGNVSEFVLDWADWKSPSWGGLGFDLQIDPTGPTKAQCEQRSGWVQARVAKGGCYLFSPRYARAAAKRYQADAGGNQFGFRFAIQEY